MAAKTIDQKIKDAEIKLFNLREEKKLGLNFGPKDEFEKNILKYIEKFKELRNEPGFVVNALFINYKGIYYNISYYGLANIKYVNKNTADMSFVYNEMKAIDMEDVWKMLDNLVVVNSKDLNSYNQKLIAEMNMKKQDYIRQFDKNKT